MSWILRMATVDDAAGIAEIYEPVVRSTPISFEIEPPGEWEIRSRIERTLEGYPWLVCEFSDRLAGYAYASRHAERAAYQWSVDTSIYVHSDFRRRRVGQALYTSLFRILAAQGYYNAYAGITLPNPGSVGLHESVGFRRIGVYREVGYKMEAWHDVGYWELALQPKPPVPRSPLSLAEIRRDPSWHEMLISGLSLLRSFQGTT
ncbi:MAG: GNAT family N-acetyltransferase [Acidobacteria bacterium]|nr:MAG: GNAT family N-acetyltransferase [Acidobacteriota bacterium]